MFLIKHRASGVLAALLVAALGALRLANAPAPSCTPPAPPVAVAMLAAR